jgi:hypothetical protein
MGRLAVPRIRRSRRLPRIHWHRGELRQGHISWSGTPLTPLQSTEAYSLWGHPTTFADISALFARFCRGDLVKLPWSSQPPASETSVITDQLAKMNELGYLTINSQPAVDGVPSDDRVHGWGPAGGYVYQKVSVGGTTHTIRE